MNPKYLAGFSAPVSDLTFQTVLNRFGSFVTVLLSVVLVYNVCMADETDDLRKHLMAAANDSTIAILAEPHLEPSIRPNIEVVRLSSSRNEEEMHANMAIWKALFTPLGNTLETLNHRKEDMLDVLGSAKIQIQARSEWKSIWLYQTERAKFLVFCKSSAKLKGKVFLLQVTKISSQERAVQSEIVRVSFAEDFQIDSGIVYFLVSALDVKPSKVASPDRQRTILGK